MGQDAYSIPPAAPSPLNNTNTLSSPFDMPDTSPNMDTIPYNSVNAYANSTDNTAENSSSTESSQNFSGLSLKKDN